MKGLRAGPWKENLPCFYPWRKKDTNASRLPPPLPTAFTACWGLGWSGHSSGCWPVSWKLPPFSQSQPLLWRRQCGHTVSALCITWAPGPLTRGFGTVANPPPSLREVPPHPIPRVLAWPFLGWSRKKWRALFSHGAREKYLWYNSKANNSDNPIIYPLILCGLFTDVFSPALLSLFLPPTPLSSRWEAVSIQRVAFLSLLFVSCSRGTNSEDSEEFAITIFLGMLAVTPSLGSRNKPTPEFVAQGFCHTVMPQKVPGLIHITGSWGSDVMLIYSSSYSKTCYQQLQWHLLHQLHCSLL